MIKRMESFSSHSSRWRKGLTARAGWEEIQMAEKDLEQCYEHFMVCLLLSSILSLFVYRALQMTLNLQTYDKIKGIHEVVNELKEDNARYRRNIADHESDSGRVYQPTALSIVEEIRGLGEVHTKQIEKLDQIGMNGTHNHRRES
jgi:hypothetical protein